MATKEKPEPEELFDVSCGEGPFGFVILNLERILPSEEYETITYSYCYNKIQKQLRENDWLLYRRTKRSMSESNSTLQREKNIIGQKKWQVF